MQKLMADKASKHVLRFLLSLRRVADNKTGCGSFCRAPFKISLIFFVDDQLRIFAVFFVGANQ